ncbi:MAG TPA: FAD-dependent oxidoreductase [Thermoleophilia bacterium]|nr:FAD-dependent oxidoreductase [Thermoleophilia bacterium]
MKNMTFSTRLLERIPRVEGVKTFRFERIKQYEFLAGQWFVLTIPEGDGYLTKHFTHSSSPTEAYIEFTTRLTGSQYKNTLDALPVGTEVEVEGPFGEFALRDDATRVAFLTGGIGITPIRSILRFMADTGDQREVVLLYGNKDHESIAFRSELKNYAERLPRVKVVHVLSEPQPDWEGHRGLIRDEILEAELGDEGGWTYYISGPPGMVTAMKDLLTARGVGRREMVLENFEGY